MVEILLVCVKATTLSDTELGYESEAAKSMKVCPTLFDIATGCNPLQSS